MALGRALQTRLKQQMENVVKCVDQLEHDDSPSSVHAVRVEGRKFETAVFLCQDFLRRNDVARFMDYCRHLRKLTDKTRNLDVLLHKFSSSENADRKQYKELKKRRRRSVQSLIEKIESLSNKKRFSKLQLRLTKQAKTRSPDCVKRRLIQLACRFSELATNIGMDLKKIHQWRIATKRIRYGFEFVEAAGFALDHMPILQQLEGLQNTLGKKTDQRIAYTETRKSSEKPNDIGNELAELSIIKNVLVMAFEVIEQPPKGRG